MLTIRNSSVTFGKSRKNEYTAFQIKTMKDMKKASLLNGWCDIYTGEAFSRNNMPTIEHFIPCSNRDLPSIALLRKSGFEINGLDNIFPVGSIGNSTRKSESFKKMVLETPVILDRLLIEMSKYSRYKSDIIDGRKWVQRLYRTMLSELQGVCSDIKTRKLIINK